MADKTWDGLDGAFAIDGNWMQYVAPAAGDRAFINAGTVTATGTLLSFLTINLNSSSLASPTLVLAGATLASTSWLQINANGANATLRLSGTVANQGRITASGAGPGAAFLLIDDGPGNSATNFVNTGLISVAGTGLQIVTTGSNAADRLENDGIISVASPSGVPLLAYVSANLAGTGAVSLGSHVTFEAAGVVGAGQAVGFMWDGGGGSTTLRIDSGALFAATISGFAASDTIRLGSGRWDKAAYASTGASSGALTLSLAGAATDSIVFNGSYSINSFNLQETVPTGSSQASTTITLNDPLFDSAYYLLHNPDVAAAGVDPYQHFMTHGWREGRNPDGLFDTSYYLSQNRDVAAANINPLIQFELYGAQQGHDPSLLFSVSKYFAANPAVQASGVDPLLQYLQGGGAVGQATFLTGGTAAADPLVDQGFYDRQLGATIVPAGLAGQQQAAWSYDATGWRRGLNPDAFFDSNYYLAQNPDVKASGLDPLTHFEKYGWREGRDPSLLFSSAKYLTANRDVKASGLDPLLHYVQYGRSEGRMAFLSGNSAAADPLIDVGYYDRQLGATLVPTGLAAQRQSASSYGSLGWQHGLNPDAFFNVNYYLSHNPDVAAAHIDPLKHYEQHGWREGRNPSALFSTNKYLTAYSDVRASGMDPLQHFLLYGQAEGRVAFAA